LARLTATRQRKLLSSGTIAQAALDSAEATLRNAEAQIIEQQALIDKKTIRAPFAGRIGLRLVDVGQVITAGTKAASLQALDRLYFDFTLPQQQLKAIKIGSDVEISTDAFPGDPRMGRVVAIDSKVDADTRNVAVRVEIANPQGNWLPGMYAKGVIAIGEPQPLITAPQTAISFNTYGDVVFVVEKEADSTDAAPHLTVRQKFVTTGERRGDQVSILGGIEDGTMIVTAGGMKLHNGSPVIISDKVPMPNDPHPNVRDQ
jgi:membrane fusion protein (multidrug efflux system)